ncbi:hypothetical protein [Paraburkholderia sp. WSM4174]|uniref:hypothetical protein n=1 Tax=Paraburkholderia TaxID=1822464 RepID=UPI003D215067
MVCCDVCCGKNRNGSSESEGSHKGGDDVDRALGALRTLAAADPRALRDPAPQVMVIRFDDSTAVLNIRVWSNTDMFWTMRWGLARRVRQTLTDPQCSLPFRTRELHIVPSATAAVIVDTAAGQPGSSAIRKPDPGGVTPVLRARELLASWHLSLDQITRAQQPATEFRAAERIGRSTQNARPTHRRELDQVVTAQRSGGQAIRLFADERNGPRGEHCGARLSPGADKNVAASRLKVKARIVGAFHPFICGQRTSVAQNSGRQRLRLFPASRNLTNRAAAACSCESIGEVMGTSGSAAGEPGEGLQKSWR